MTHKVLKIIFIIIVIVVFIWGFSDSYKAHTIDNIVHVVAIGIDKCNNGQNNMKVSFQFVNMSSSGKDSSGGETSTVVTSISTTTINKAINLMNSYIGKELNFSHCKVIVFSEAFAKEGISTEICTLVNDEEIRPSTNIVVSTSDANTYLKNSNPNIEKLVTNYYDTFELTSNFTGYSDDTTIGKFYNKLFNASSANTAILGRTFKKVSDSGSGEQSSSAGGTLQGSNQGSSGSDSQDGSQGASGADPQSGGQGSSGSGSQGGDQGTSSGSSQDSGQGDSGGEGNYSSEGNQNAENGKNISGSTEQNDSSGSSLEISGQRGTQNVGIAVFKDAKYVGQLSEMDSICHLLITNNVDSFIISIPMEGYPDNLLDLNVSALRGTKIKVDTSSDTPKISVSVYCEGKVLTVDKDSDYVDSDILKDISSKASEFLKQHIEAYLNKTCKKFKADITGFSNHALSNFLTTTDWKNYNWTSKYENANFTVKVDFDITSSLLFSGD